MTTQRELRKDEIGIIQVSDHLYFTIRKDRVTENGEQRFKVGHWNSQTDGYGHNHYNLSFNSALMNLNDRLYTNFEQKWLSNFGIKPRTLIRPFYATYRNLENVTTVTPDMIIDYVFNTLTGKKVYQKDGQDWDSQFGLEKLYIDLYRRLPPYKDNHPSGIEVIRSLNKKHKNPYDLFRV